MTAKPKPPPYDMQSAWVLAWCERRSRTLFAAVLARGIVDLEARSRAEEIVRIRTAIKRHAARRRKR